MKPQLLGHVTVYGKEITDCTTCMGMGWLRYEDVPRGPLFGKSYRCPECSRTWLREHSGLRPQELALRLAQWGNGRWPGEVREEYTRQRRAARAMMAEVIASRKGLITLYGDFGAGKTRALQTVIAELIELHVPAVYVPMPLLLDHLRDLYAEGKSGSAYWERICSIQALAVDEVTRFNATPWARERLWLLADIRYRMRDEVLTLFATNDDPRLELDPAADVGYLYSRMRQGKLIELRGDMRPAFSGQAAPAGAAAPAAWSGPGDAAGLLGRDPGG